MTQTSEIYSTNNFSDKQFQKMFLPLRLLQHVLFLSSFHIDHNCIRPHNYFYHTISFIGTLSFVIFYSVNYFEMSFKKYCFFINVINTFNGYFLIIAFIVFYCLNVIQRIDSAQMVLYIQKALRIINYKHHRFFYIWNWVYVIIHFVIFCFGSVLYCDLQTICLLYTLIYFDVNISYGLRIMALIQDAMVTWIAEFECYCKLGVEFGEEKYKEHLERLFDTYLDLVRAFGLFKRIFQFAVRIIFVRHCSCN